MYTESRHLFVPDPLNSWYGKATSVSTHLALAASCAYKPNLVAAYKTILPAAFLAVNKSVT